MPDNHISTSVIPHRAKAVQVTAPEILDVGTDTAKLGTTGKRDYGYAGANKKSCKGDERDDQEMGKWVPRYGNNVLGALLC